MKVRAIEMANGAVLTISFHDIQYIQARCGIFYGRILVFGAIYMALFYCTLVSTKTNLYLYKYLYNRSIHEAIIASYFSLGFSSADNPTTFLNVPKLKQSLIRLAPEKSMTRRSTPHPQPPVGGRP
jgi:hypothetical protein